MKITQRDGKAARLIAVALVGMFAATAFAASNSEALREHFDEGLRNYQMDRHGEAAEAFRKMTGLDPTPAEAYELREAVGRSQMAALLKEEAFREEILEIFQLSYEHMENLRQDAEKIQEYVDQLQHEDNRVVWQAIHSLDRIGPLAVPYLLEPLSSFEVSEGGPATIPARIVLKNMGRRATPPLVQALKANTVAETPEAQAAAERSDAHLKLEICRLFAASKDIRAKAPLQALVEWPDTNPVVRQQALNTLRTLEAYPPEPQQSYLDLARMYIEEDPRVVETVSTFDRIVWRWREAPNASYRDRLVHESPPAFLYPAMMAQQAMLDAMNYQQTTPDLLALYVANNYRMLSLAKDAQGREELSEDTRTAAAERAEEFAYVTKLNEQLGAAYVYMALDRALATSDRLLALDCIAGLRAVADPRPTAESRALFAALESNYPDVRFAAAEAIVKISPQGRLVGGARRPVEREETAAEEAAVSEESERAPQPSPAVSGDPNLVVSAIHSLLTRSGRRRVLVATGNRGFFDEIAEILRTRGYQAELALESSAAIQSIRRPIPSVDVLIADVGEDLELLFHFVARDVRTRRLPIVVLAPEERASRAEETYDAPVVAYPEALAIKPSELAEALEEAIDLKGQAGPAPSDEFLRQTLETLSGTPARTAYPLGNLVPTLMALIEEKETDVGLMSLKILQGLEDMRSFDMATRLFLNEDTHPEMRVEAGRLANLLIHRVDSLSDARVQKLEEMSVGADEALRDLAIHALAKAPLEIEKRRQTAKSIAEKHIWGEQ